MTVTNQTLQLWQIGGTPKGYLFARSPKQAAQNAAGVWIPRSVIQKLDRLPAQLDEWPRVLVTLPVWMIRRKKLEQCVIGGQP